MNTHCFFTPKWSLLHGTSLYLARLSLFGRSLKFLFCTAYVELSKSKYHLQKI